MQRVRLSPLIARKFIHQEPTILRINVLVACQADVTNNENDKKRVCLNVFGSISKERCRDHVKKGKHDENCNVCIYECMYLRHRCFGDVLII